MLLRVIVKYPVMVHTYVTNESQPGELQWKYRPKLYLHLKIYLLLCFALWGYGCSEHNPGKQVKNNEIIQRDKEPVVLGQVDFRANLVVLPDGAWQVYSARNVDGRLYSNRKSPWITGRHGLSRKYCGNFPAMAGPERFRCSIQIKRFTCFSRDGVKKKAEIRQ